MLKIRCLAILLLTFLATLAFGDNGTLRLNLLPTITVADSRSTITVSAYVYRTSGQPVPDGTRVLFQTTLGTFKGDEIGETQNGVARVVLQTGSIAGTAKVTASALAFNAVSTTEIEFLADRSMLSSANEYVEIVAPGYMMFSMDQKIIGAAGPKHGAKLRYREIEIEADDLQLNVSSSEVRAKKARLKIGKQDKEFDTLYMKLPARQGTGLTTFEAEVTDEDGVTSKRQKLGYVDVRSSGITPVTKEVNANQFAFQDLSESTSLISADKVVVFPRKVINFHKADIMVGGVKVMKLPLFQVSLNSASPVVTDSILNLNDSQININYPYYLTLKPGQTSLFRFQTGNKYGRSSGVDRGISLDYEMNWNKGDDFDGGLAFTSIGKGNWGLSARQYIRFDDRSSGLGYLEMPAGRSLYGSLSYNRQFDGWGMNISTSGTNSLRGSQFSNQQAQFVLEKDPIKFGKWIRTSLGLNASANSSRSSLQERSQSAMGLHVRTQLVPLKLDGSTLLNANFTIGEQVGHNTVNGLTAAANLSLSKNIGKYAGILVGYDFLEDGFNSGLTGKHQLNLQGNYAQGNFDSSFSAVRALDVDRFSLFADLGYRLNNTWRLSYSYTLDRYFGNTYLDYTAAIGYRIGWRELGLTYSGRTKRFGIQLLGTPIN